jgi:hypothetical protein
MAFTFAKQYDFVAGDLRFTAGTFTNSAGGTGGDIYTGLQKAEGLLIQHKGSAAVATFPVVNEVFPKADPITIVTAADKSGYWLAFGH